MFLGNKQKGLWLVYPLFGENHKAEQLIFKTLDRHGEVYNRGLCAHFRRVRGVAELRGDVQPEVLHHVDLLVADLHLQSASGLDEVLLEDVVESRVEFLADVLDQQRTPEGQSVFQVASEVLVI